jgi:hypothetical protein
VSNKSHVCDDLIGVPLGIFTLSGMCAACLLVHGAVADKKYLCIRSSVLLYHPLLLLRWLRYSLKLMQIDLV